MSAAFWKCESQLQKTDVKSFHRWIKVMWILKKPNNTLFHIKILILGLSIPSRRICINISMERKAFKHSMAANCTKRLLGCIWFTSEIFCLNGKKSILNILTGNREGKEGIKHEMKLKTEWEATCTLNKCQHWNSCCSWCWNLLF